MKKIFLIFISVFSLTILSCVTDKVESEKDLFETPETTPDNEELLLPDYILTDKNISENNTAQNSPAANNNQNQKTNSNEQRNPSASIRNSSKQNNTQNGTNTSVDGTNNIPLPDNSQKASPDTQSSNKQIVQPQTNTNKTNQTENTKTDSPAKTDNQSKTNDLAKSNNQTSKQTANSNQTKADNQSKLVNQNNKNNTQNSNTGKTNQTATQKNGTNQTQKALDKSVTNNKTNAQKTTQQNQNQTQKQTINSSKNQTANQNKIVKTDRNQKPVNTQNNGKQTEPKKEETLAVPESEESKIKPSRQVTLKRGETLSLVYPGSGWIYLGSDAEYNNLTSTGRVTDNTKTSYTLVAKESGTQIHHFYKIDNITGNYIDDYIEVEVLGEKGNISNVVKAPEYSLVVPERPVSPASAVKKPIIPEKEETDYSKRSFIEYTPEPAKKAENKSLKTPEYTDEPGSKVITGTQQQEEDSITEEQIDVSGYLTKANELYNQKNYSEAEKYINSFLEYSNDNRDEALFIKGQILESEGPQKNIKDAISTYQTLTDNYPSSIYWDRANKRIIYLKRFYIHIR